MRVLSPEQYITGQFPKKAEDIGREMDYFESKAVIPFIGKKIYGGFRHGSSSTGGGTILSDADYFLVIADEGHRHFVKSVVGEIFARSSVFIECIPYNLERAVGDDKELEDLFYLTLQSSVRKTGFVGENPLEVFRPKGIPFLRAVRDSLDHYLTRLDKLCNEQVMSESHRLLFLKEILNKPFDAMRNMIQYARHERGLDFAFNDSKQAMMGQYAEFFGKQKKLAGIIRDIYNVMRSYASYVEHTIGANVIYGYMVQLDRIEEMHMPARTFIEENSRLVVSSRLPS